MGVTCLATQKKSWNRCGVFELYLPSSSIDTNILTHFQDNLQEKSIYGTCLFKRFGNQLVAQYEFLCYVFLPVVNL